MQWLVLSIFILLIISRKLVTNVELLTKIQTYKGLGFILITSGLLYVLVKRNINTTASYYQQIIDLKQTSDIQLKNQMTNTCRYSTIVPYLNGFLI